MTSKSTRQQRQRVLAAVGPDWQGAVGIAFQVKLSPLVIALVLGDPGRLPHTQQHTLLGRGDVEGRWNSTRGQCEWRLPRVDRPDRFESGNDYTADEDNHWYGIHDLGPARNNWHGNRVIIYGDEELRDRILRLLNDDEGS